MSFHSVRRTKSEMVASIDGEISDAKLIGHSTLRYKQDGFTVIRFHLTDVATINPDGSVTVDSGGFQTFTTKKRINEYLPACASLYQEKHVWYVHVGSWSDGKRYLFEDGMTVAPDGTVSGAELAPRKGRGSTKAA